MVYSELEELSLFTWQKWFDSIISVFSLFDGYLALIPLAALGFKIKAAIATHATLGQC